MSLLESLRSWLVGQSQGPLVVEYVGPSVTDVLGMSPEALFRTQPHLRTVVTFLARNLAQLPLNVFERVSDTDRRRDDGSAARLLRRPNPTTTQYGLVYSLMADRLLYDEAFLLLTQDPDRGWELRNLPPNWVVERRGGDRWGPEKLVIADPETSRRTEIPAENFMYWHGWRPGVPARGASPIEALREVLAEQIQAWSYRQQVWQRGGRAGAYITRPAGAPDWSKEAREKFQRDWSAKWAGPEGPKAGGTPLFEDGMELKRVAFSAREEEWSEVAKLSLATVAAVYHTSPTMVGILDNANFSNVKEFARMLYTDTLGPYLRDLELLFTDSLIPRLDPDRDLYAEFNIQAKLAGSFEEQAAVVSTAVGRPWMTADEARGKFNMRALGGDAAQLVTPLNVLIGGQASPRDSGSQNRNAGGPATKGAVLTRESASEPLHLKAETNDADAAEAAETLRRFFKRQRAEVLSELGSKDPAWWDGERWDRELSDDLYALSIQVTEEIGRDTMLQLGAEPDDYSAPRTEKFLREVAASRAGAINAKTRDQIEKAIAGDVSEDAAKSDPAGVFDQAETTRAEQSGRTLATTLAAFAVIEAAAQFGRPETTKTWVVTSSNPRASHAGLDGETVPIGEPFSNGMDWPGDPFGGADEVANCSCVVDITIP